MFVSELPKITESLTRPAFQLAAADVLAALQSDANIGLSDAEAQRRLAAYGPNELASEPPIPRWRRLLAQFTNVLVLLLLAATVISVIAWLLEGAEGLPYEAFAIIAIVIVNALIGFFQEERAEDAVAALRKMTTAMAVVLRDGRQQQIDSHAIDARRLILLVEASNLQSAPMACAHRRDLVADAR